MESAHEHNLRNKPCLCLGESMCMHCDTFSNGGRRNPGEKNGWINCYFCFVCAKKSILVASQNWSWATDLTWTVLPMSLLRFWTWEHYSCVAVYGGSDSYPI